MSELSVAIIGLGVGRQHALAYRRNSPGTKIFLCDLDSNLCDKVGSEIVSEANFTDWRELLKLELDAVSICSFDNYHTQQIIAFAEKGVSIMVEKPMCLNQVELDKISSCRAIREVIVNCNFIMREYPRFKKIKKIIRDGVLGDIFYVEAGYMHFIEHKIVSGWRGEIEGYTPVIGGGIHLLDQLTYIFGFDIEKVTGVSNQIATKNTNFKNSDTLVNLIKFKSGMIAKLTSTYSSRRPKLHTFNVYGTKASLEHRDEGIYFYPNDNPTDSKLYELPYPGIEKGGKIDQFVSDIQLLKSVGQIKSELEYLLRLHDLCFWAQKEAL